VGEEQDVVLFASGGTVVVEVVYNEGAAIRGKVNVEFEEKRDKGGGCRSVGGETEQEVA